MLDMAERVQGLFRNSRPGFPEHRVSRATVDAWMAEAHRAGKKLCPKWWEIKHRLDALDL